MIESDRDLFVRTLRELLTIEYELERRLSELADASTDEELESHFMGHAETTTEQVGRLETVFDGLEDADFEPRESEVLEALLTDHDELVADVPDPNLADRRTTETGRAIERLELTKLETLLVLSRRLDLPTEVVEPLERTRTEAETGLERLQESAGLTV
ncbi:DUF892 family protein [Halovivax sp.]|uniref:DUF892 family protein n=1 Tax=Halovivax sp. TaxID=1935978 RepID=UPI0025BC7481|nr:DUF892 family protein [Halovivax sp.]